LAWSSALKSFGRRAFCGGNSLLLSREIEFFQGKRPLTYPWAAWTNLTSERSGGADAVPCQQSFLRGYKFTCVAGILIVQAVLFEKDAWLSAWSILFNQVEPPLDRAAGADEKDSFWAGLW